MCLSGEYHLLLTGISIAGLQMDADEKLTMNGEEGFVQIIQEVVGASLIPCNLVQLGSKVFILMIFGSDTKDCSSDNVDYPSVTISAHRFCKPKLREIYSSRRRKVIREPP